MNDTSFKSEGIGNGIRTIPRIIRDDDVGTRSDPIRVSPIHYVEHPVAFVPTPTTSVIYAPESQTTPPSSPLDVTMLAIMGLTLAGAGMMKTQTAVAKQNEQATQQAQALAQLQAQQSAQKQTAQANWAENQAMQASAKQAVVTQVTQSQANKDFWSAYAEWQKQVVRRLEAIKQAQQLAWRNQVRNVLEMRPPRGSESLLQLYYTGSFSLSQLENAYERGYIRQLRSDYGVILSDNDNPTDDFRWSLPAIYNVFLGTEVTAKALFNIGSLAPYATLNNEVLTKENIFKSVMGQINLKLVNSDVESGGITMFDQGRTIDFYPYAGIRCHD